MVKRKAEMALMAPPGGRLASRRGSYERARGFLMMGCEAGDDLASLASIYMVVKDILDIILEQFVKRSS